MILHLASEGLMNAFVFLGKWFWAICILMMIATAIRFRVRGIKQIRMDPALAPGYRTLSWNFVFWSSIPWLVMGVGCIFRRVPDVWSLFRPAEGNPFVLAFFASVVLIWGLGTYWLLFRGGAEMLVRHPGLFDYDFKTPRAVKAVWFLALASGVVGVVMVFVHPFPKPAWDQQRAGQRHIQRHQVD